MGQMISIVQVKNKGACAEVGRERGINQSGYVVCSFNRSSLLVLPHSSDYWPRQRPASASRLLSAKHFGRRQRPYPSGFENLFYDG
ncbi:hypothetical protein HETIRDRAFT_149193 [Heterobasidion irregulare TC 32-1]|uniref:Uncharacterized protein n=1 Tax=Heterobasidion irregulare (strain TC 32-1) TaxID=747525 RepID=W4JZS7_HETIT|nr:uncharacterized protein HETIRDRAFT_149193 [Heterobasidion irregulare TC 32-1]ETW78346.1 hypothetical protein HETIRDRAFT_149193 [Heterobasidion irregulare TC 32-1]